MKFNEGVPNNTPISTKTAKYLMEAANEATKSDLNYRHGAVLVNGHKIISTGYNQTRSKYGNICTSCLHAEAACIHNYVKCNCHEPFNGKIKILNIEEFYEIHHYM